MSTDMVGVLCLYIQSRSSKISSSIAYFLSLSLFASTFSLFTFCKPDTFSIKKIKFTRQYVIDLDLEEFVVDKEYTALRKHGKGVGASITKESYTTRMTK